MCLIKYENEYLNVDFNFIAYYCNFEANNYFLFCNIHTFRFYLIYLPFISWFYDQVIAFL